MKGEQNPVVKALPLIKWVLKKLVSPMLDSDYIILLKLDNEGHHSGSEIK